MSIPPGWHERQIASGIKQSTTMQHSKVASRPAIAKPFQAFFAILALLLALPPTDATAIPAFNRQTGQNCVACHAGGQFPELTPTDVRSR